MKVKKYVAPTMPEVMNTIRKELGPDAVILNSKEVQDGGFLGFFRKKKIEVIAALDPQPIKARSSNAFPRSRDISIPSNGNLKNNPTNEVVLNEIKYLKKMIEHQSTKKETRFQLDYQIVYEHLLEQEVAEDLAGDIVNAVVKSHIEIDRLKTIRDIHEDTKTEIEKRLNQISFQGIDYTKKIVHFVGPTGVGKTTTLAKIAAKSMLKDNKKVAFITVDTYRVAAIEQLKTYANILDVPLEVVYSLEDYQKAINKFQAYDLILVDTAGRNFREKQYVQELMKHIESSNDVETYLVLSLTAKQNDLLEIVHQFEHVPIKELIFTKIDETRQYGSILTLSSKDIGIAYMTNGQDVPEDLINPTPQEISNLIMEELIDG